MGTCCSCYPETWRDEPEKKSQELEHSGVGQKEPGSSKMSLHHGPHPSGLLLSDMRDYLYNSSYYSLSLP